VFVSIMELQRFTADDTDALAAWFTDEAALVQWGGADVVFPLDRAQMVPLLREAAADPPTRWLVNGVVRNEVVAHAQCALDWRHGVARLARVSVNPACRGSGLAAPFLRLILARVFVLPGFERVELNVYSFNTAAIRTYERLGFVREGVRRSSVRVGAERWDTAMFALLRSQWAAAATNPPDPPAPSPHPE
jgi:RimJ/RimL family protein N-acetyltransferase